MERIEIAWSLYADDTVLCGELEKDLSRMVGWFGGVCRKRLKANTGKSSVMTLNGKEGLECEVHVNGIRLEHVAEFKYLECVLNESGTDGAEYNRMVTVGRGLQYHHVSS